MGVRSEPLFVLASGSPRRKELLARMGFDFEVHPAECDERPRSGEPAEDYARRMAKEKAEAVTSLLPSRWVLAADTVVVVDGAILGKPGDENEAAAMIATLAGKTHSVITSYCWSHGRRGTVRVCSVKSLVEFKPLDSGEIGRYVDTGEPMDKAGAYAVQGLGAFMVRAVHGSYSNVVGLPLCEVIDTMVELGVIPEFPVSFDRK